MPFRQQVQKLDRSLPYTQVHVWTNLVLFLSLHHPLQNFRPLHAAVVHRGKPQQGGGRVLSQQRAAAAQLCLDNAAFPGFRIFLCDDVATKMISSTYLHHLGGANKTDFRCSPASVAFLSPSGLLIESETSLVCFAFMSTLHFHISDIFDNFFTGIPPVHFKKEQLIYNFKSTCLSICLLIIRVVHIFYLILVQRTITNPCMWTKASTCKFIQQ